MIIVFGLKRFFNNFISISFSIFTFLSAGMLYLVGYPGKMTVLTMVLVFFCLDFATRAYAIKVQNGGLFKALVLGKFSSRAFINGFITKILAYFTILVSANYAEITPELGFVGDGAASVLYCSLFFYELISNLENLIDAGLKWLKPILDKLKREQQKFMNGEEVVVKEVESVAVTDDQNA